MRYNDDEIVVKNSEIKTGVYAEATGEPKMSALGAVA